MMRIPDFQIFKINKDMKKTARILFSLICVSAALVACKKENATSSEEQLITAYVNAGPVNKLAYEEVMEGGGAGVQSYWQTGDHFLAIQDGEKVIDFKLISGAGTTQGVFQALTSGVTSSTNWVGVVGNGAEAHGNEIHCGFMKQNGTISNLSGYNYVKVSATGDEPYFNFAEGEGLSYVLRVKLPAGIKCVEYNPCAWYKVTADGVTEQLYSTGNSGQEPNYKAFSASYTTTITFSTASTKGEAIYIAVPPINCNLGYEDYNSKKQYGNLRTGFVLTFLNNTSDDADKSNGVVLGGDKDQDFDLRGKGGLIGTYDYSELELINRPKPSDAILITTDATSTTKNDGTTSIFSTSKQAVSGLETYWAPFNVGAASVSESGYFVGYGEMKERKTGDFASYTLRQKGSDGTNRPAIICYTHAAFPGSGSTTFYTIAGTRYDIARVKWGIAWRMPHLIEAWTLWRDHLSSLSTTTVGGQKCIKIDNGKGQSLHFPCYGWYSDSGALKDADMAGIWTGDKNQRSASNAGWDQAYALQCSSTSQSYEFVDRYGMHRSLNVRPVLASSEIK